MAAVVVQRTVIRMVGLLSWDQCAPVTDRLPAVALACEQPVEQRHEGHAEEEREERCVGAVEGELDDESDAGNRRAEDHAAGRAVRRRFRVRDHEKREHEQRAVREVVERDGERIAEQSRSHRDQHCVAAEERKRRLRAAGAGQDDESEAGKRQCRQCAASPLAARDPGAVGGEHEADDRPVGRIEQVLAPDADQELARDRDDGGEHRQPEAVRSQQHGQRQPGDERAPRLERAAAFETAAEILGGLRAAEHDGGMERFYAYVQQRRAGDDEDREHGDLVIAGVGQRVQPVHAACKRGGRGFGGSGPPGGTMPPGPETARIASKPLPACIRMHEGRGIAPYAEAAMHEEYIPIVMFVVIGAVLGLFYFFRYRTRAEMQRTVRIALERGHDLSPELIDRLGEPRKSAITDMRRGAVAVGLALGLALFGFALGEEDALRPLLATSMLPLFVGLAYLVLYWINRNRDDT